MGLTTWSGGALRKSDVTVSKNYLREAEISELNRIVGMFLDYAEDQAQRKRQVFLKIWQQKIDEFLRFNERQVLPDAGSVSHDEAITKAEEEYRSFAQRRRELKEAQAETDTFRTLEESAKALPKRANPRKR